MRVRLLGGGALTGEESFPITPRRRPRMAAMSNPNSNPTPSVIVRTDAEIARMLAIVERAAGIGPVQETSNGTTLPPADEIAEGFRLCIRWMRGEVDDVTVMVNWLTERGELPK